MVDIHHVFLLGTKTNLKKIVVELNPDWSENDEKTPKYILSDSSEEDYYKDRTDSLDLSFELPDKKIVKNLEVNKEFKYFFEKDSTKLCFFDLYLNEDVQFLGIPVFYTDLKQGYYEMDAGKIIELLNDKENAINMINEYGFNLKPDDIKVYHCVWQEY